MDIKKFSSQLEHNANALKSRAILFTKDEDDADDLVQDTLIKAYRFLERFQDGTDFKAWLFVIMRNTFINSFRKKQRWSAVFTPQSEADNNLLYGATSNQAERNFAGRDIAAALNRLPDSYRVPFVRYFEGYQYQEIANELGLPLGTVKTHIYQARAILKKNLRKYREDLPGT
ncbi:MULTISPECIES: sigma-70 family RNA polymerase sigma factor [Pedobacter]|uniref:RNA polymerase sigma factor n=1 Tax=Pedobacter zeae TaxID=1737356 RepID=A0A7W6KCW4_9SPHI|nr:sigma-70 family RNA polymerase sigma factor [Pedobacter zeae]MBB4108365.1 RNA polymerase sigma-70 factor (ECF subfamily) [Pedobacter zeae]GGG93252.1 RNA polymerase sigma factor [Pedobacter zeae]